MKQLILPLLVLLLVSCSSVKNKLFNKQTPHESYAEKLGDTGLENTPGGRLWLAAAQKALDAPHPVDLPYRLQGYFPADKPRALGLRFTARQGEQLHFSLNRKAPASVIYADLFRAGSDRPQHLLAADTASASFSFIVNETGEYFLRLQPELFKTGDYALSIDVGPSVIFPVDGKKASIGSIWGDDRDGGRRLHEGIDIFAPKGTPALAAADGYIVGVREGGLGGRTVWLRPNDRNLNFYYAHLDQQLVQEGQFVKKGDVVGLVGNTGNARTTPSHMHFGVYGPGGAVDPLPFVNRAVKSAPALAPRSLNQSVRAVKAQKTAAGTVSANTVLIPIGISRQGYLAESPEGQLVQLPLSAVKLG